MGGVIVGIEVMVSGLCVHNQPKALKKNICMHMETAEAACRILNFLAAPIGNGKAKPH